MNTTRRAHLMAALASLAPQTLSAQSTQLGGPVRTIPLRAKLAHVQGIDTDGARLWVTSVDRASRRGFLQEFSLPSGELTKTVEVQDGDRYHPGGFSRHGDSLWIPVAEYRALSSAVIQQRSAATLELLSQFAVDDHIGCLAASEGELIGGNWDSRQFYVWTAQGQLLRKTDSPTKTAYQDMKLTAGALVAGGTIEGKGRVDWLSYPELKPLRSIDVGRTSRGEPLTREGLAMFGTQLWLLPEDGDSRLFIFDLPR